MVTEHQGLAESKARFKSRVCRARNLRSEQQTLSGLQALSDGAAAIIQAVQTGNMIAVHQKCSSSGSCHVSLQMAQVQGELLYFFATEQQTEVSKYAMLSAWFESQKTYRSSE